MLTLCWVKALFLFPSNVKLRGGFLGRRRRSVQRSLVSETARGLSQPGLGKGSFRVWCACAEVPSPHEEVSQSVSCRGHPGVAARTSFKAPGPTPEPSTAAQVQGGAGQGPPRPRCTANLVSEDGSVGPHGGPHPARLVLL